MQPIQPAKSNMCLSGSLFDARSFIDTLVCHGESALTVGSPSIGAATSKIRCVAETRVLSGSLVTRDAAHFLVVAENPAGFINTRELNDAVAL
jgi:hypothetical protein